MLTWGDYMQNRDFISYIDGIPAASELVKENAEQEVEKYNESTSDHTPTIATVQTGEKRFRQGEIKVLSWNVLEDDAGSGFALNGQYGYQETPNQRDKRHEKITETLQVFATQHDPQFITLQEISGRDKDEVNTTKDSLYKRIQAALGNKYAVVPGSLQSGCITFYRTDQFVPVVDNNDTFKTSDYIEGTVTKFHLLEVSQIEFRIANTHHKFSERIAHQEHSIKRFLTGADSNTPAKTPAKKTISIISGDFNGTIKQKNKQKQKSITSVSSLCAMNLANTKLKELDEVIEKKIQVQGGWSIDGCFSSVSLPGQTKETIKCHQADVILLNPKTKKAYTAEELKPIDTSNLHPLQQQQILTQRAAICVDEAYETAELVPVTDADMQKKLTLSQYEETLKKLFGSDQFLVRESVNLNGDTGLSISIPSELYTYLKLLGKEDTYSDAIYIDNFCLEEKEDIGRQKFYVISTDNSHALELTNRLSEIAKNKPLFSFAKAINEIPDYLVFPSKTKKEKTTKVKEHFAELFKCLVNDKENNTDSYTTVREHFTHLAKELTKIGNKKAHVLTPKMVQKSADELEAKLYGKPPISPKAKAIIFALIGAIFGLVLGASIGGVIGFWSGRKNQDAYEARKAKIADKISEGVKKEKDNTFNVLRHGPAPSRH